SVRIDRRQEGYATERATHGLRPTRKAGSTGRPGAPRRRGSPLPRRRARGWLARSQSSSSIWHECPLAANGEWADSMEMSYPRAVRIMQEAAPARVFVALREELA